MPAEQTINTVNDHAITNERQRNKVLFGPLTKTLLADVG